VDSRDNRSDENDAGQDPRFAALENSHDPVDSGYRS
jgi:hypothetical protein